MHQKFYILWKHSNLQKRISKKLTSKAFPRKEFLKLIEEFVLRCIYNNTPNDILNFKKMKKNKALTETYQDCINHKLILSTTVLKSLQKQPSRGVLKKSCSENTQ